MAPSGTPMTRGESTARSRSLVGQLAVIGLVVSFVLLVILAIWAARVAKVQDLFDFGPVIILLLGMGLYLVIGGLTTLFGCMWLGMVSSASPLARNRMPLRTAACVIAGLFVFPPVAYGVIWGSPMEIARAVALIVLWVTFVDIFDREFVEPMGVAVLVIAGLCVASYFVAPSLRNESSLTALVGLAIGLQASVTVLLVSLITIGSQHLVPQPLHVLDLPPPPETPSAPQPATDAPQPPAPPGTPLPGPPTGASPSPKDET